jgi:hypothetical protein
MSSDQSWTYGARLYNEYIKWLDAFIDFTKKDMLDSVGYISHTFLHIVSPQKLASSIYSMHVLHVSNKIWHFACSHMQMMMRT